MQLTTSEACAPERAVPVRFPFFVLEDLPRASREERDRVRDESRARYAEPLKSRDGDEPPDATSNDQDPKEPPDGSQSGPGGVDDGADNPTRDEGDSETTATPDQTDIPKGDSW